MPSDRHSRDVVKRIGKLVIEFDWQMYAINLWVFDLRYKYHDVTDLQIISLFSYIIKHTGNTSYLRHGDQGARATAAIVLTNRR